MINSVLSNIVLPLVSGAASAAIVSGLFAVVSKRMEFAHAYYKEIIDRRVETYAELERLIHSIKIAVHDGADGKLYHMLFSKDDDYQGVYRQLHDVMSRSLWLSEAAFQDTRKLNLLLLRYTQSAAGGGLIAFGKAHYQQIAILRERLERTFATDMMSLHRVRSFLRHKRPTRKFEELQLES